MGEPNGRHYVQIAEIFTSIQGEGRLQGELTTFIRTAGCNLTCAWCDTVYAQSGGQKTIVKEIVKTVRGAGVDQVCVTGGEPLHQPEIQALFSDLRGGAFFVSVETNGTRDIGAFTEVDAFSVDYKLPSAGAGEPFYAGNWAALRPVDELKFVIADRADYETAQLVMGRHETAALIVMSPCLDMRPDVGGDRPGAVRSTLAADLAQWIIADKLPVRYSIQLHKLLGVR